MSVTKRERDHAVEKHKEKSFELEEAKGNNQHLLDQIKQYEDMIAEKDRKEEEQMTEIKKLKALDE